MYLRYTWERHAREPCAYAEKMHLTFFSKATADAQSFGLVLMVFGRHLVTM